jgi:hypothetical protein
VESFLKLDLPENDKRKILWDNCARFYGAATFTPANSVVSHKVPQHVIHT